MLKKRLVAAIAAAVVSTTMLFGMATNVAAYDRQYGYGSFGFKCACGYEAKSYSATCPKCGRGTTTNRDISLIQFNEDMLRIGSQEYYIATDKVIHPDRWK